MPFRDVWSSPGLHSILKSLVECSDLTASLYNGELELVDRVFHRGNLIEHLSHDLSEKFIPEMDVFEKKLIGKSPQGNDFGSYQFANRLDVEVIPLKLLGKVEGILVIGYVFTRYPSPEDCQHLSRAFGDTYLRMWHRARKDLPSTKDKMNKFAFLYQSVLESHLAGTISGLKLQAADNLKDELLSVVSHELKTPLSAGLLRLQMLEKKLQRDKEIDFELEVKTLISTFRSQETIINDLLDVAKISQGQLRYNKELTNLNTILKKCVEEIKPLIERKDVSLQMDFSTEDIEMILDPVRIKQVFINLLNNAVKFTEKGSVKVILDTHEGKARVAIKDTGMGLDQEALGRIFSKFVQASSNQSSKGLGLGLFLTEQIVRAHNGNISVESEGLHLGATFIVELPYE